MSEGIVQLLPGSRSLLFFVLHGSSGLGIDGFELWCASHSENREHFWITFFNNNALEDMACITRELLHFFCDLIHIQMLTGPLHYDHRSGSIVRHI